MKETHGSTHGLAEPHMARWVPALTCETAFESPASVLAAGRGRGLVLSWSALARGGGDSMKRFLRAYLRYDQQQPNSGRVSRKGDWLWLSHRR
jgi:hypothetical protein